MKNKLNLNCKQFPLQDHVNVGMGIATSQTISDNYDYIIGDYSNLEPVLGDNKFDEIRFEGFVNEIVPDKFLDTISQWKKMLSPNGKLFFSFIDIRKIGRDILEGHPINNIHNNIMGEQYQYKMILDTMTIKSILHQLGFVINKLQPQPLHMAVEASLDGRIAN
jgi:hypothetical protein